MVEIKITGNTPLEALSSLTAFGMHCMQNKDVWNATNRILEAEKHAEAKKAADAPSAPPPPPPPPPADPSGPAAGENGPTAAPSEKPAPAAATQPETADAPAPGGGKPPSLEDIRAKGIEAAKKHGQPAVKAILQELGAANMTALPEDKRAAFLEKLEGLGDGNA